MGLQPIVQLGLCQTQDILVGVGRGLAAVDVQEVQATGSLVQILGIAGGIAVLADIVLPNQSSGLGVIFLFANDLLHKYTFLSGYVLRYYTAFWPKCKIKLVKIHSFKPFLLDKITIIPAV